MEWFGIHHLDQTFEMFTLSHLLALGIFLLVTIFIYVFKNNLKKDKFRKFEVGIALFLFLSELLYHLWMIHNEIWFLYDSLPLELCSISLILTILLLWTRNKLIYELVFFTSILGASQALLTPVLAFEFPHFRFLHFFITHMIMIWVSLYFTWVKGYRPTFKSVIKVFIFLNILLPIVILINNWSGGNYMFLSRKPESTSLLDVLGPYPFYIFSLEFLLIVLSLILWAIFRERQTYLKRKDVEK